MRTRTIPSPVATLTLAALSIAAACSRMPSPVPVVGEPDDVRTLAGDWYGEYWTLDAVPERSGSIYFRLSAGADTADGDVVMTVRSANPDARWASGEFWRQAAERHEILSIRFVHAAAGRVTGTLEAYADPTCGCQLTTTFSGSLANDSIAGTFSSLHADGHRTGGRWQARRR